MMINSDNADISYLQDIIKFVKSHTRLGLQLF